ncbi:MAG: FeoB-associated Cys-rich membrane protein [Candidatus Omnitrophica bacterium]|nr:FeoB-associated Cys-rich membrane protein [Candidatus Omnitrophota bacterium]
MQKVVVIFLVVLSVVYLIQRMAKHFKKGAKGGCCGCSADKETK